MRKIPVNRSFIIQRAPSFAVQLLNQKAPKEQPLHLIEASFEIGPKRLRNNNQTKIVAQKKEAMRVCFLLRNYLGKRPPDTAVLMNLQGN